MSGKRDLRQSEDRRRAVDDPGHELAMALRAAYMALHRETEAAVASHGVTADQFVVLAALAGGEARTQRELVARTGSDPSTLRAMLVLLEKRGLVERRPHPTDGRARSVRLTASGRRALGRTWKATEPVRQRLFQSQRPPKGERLTPALERVADLLSQSPSIVESSTKGP
jgi:DNA-binding MarR family transcriptional regulator